MAARAINNHRPTGILSIDITVGAASGDATIIAAGGAGKVIRVYRMVVSSSIANTLTVKSGSTALTGAIGMAAASPMVLDVATEWTPWFVTGPNEAFILNNSAIAALGGHVTYSVETA